MARIRSIKPEFFTSGDVLSLSPLARLLYIALWCEADRDGRLKWDPKTLKYRYLPADDCDVNELAEELTFRRMLELYQVNGTRLAWLPTFTRHQVINNRERESTLPPPPDLPLEGKGKEGREGKEGNRVSDASPRVSDASRKPPGPGAGVSDEFREFFNAYHPTKRDRWETAWQVWVAQGCQTQAERVMEALQAFQACSDWKRDGGRYVPGMVRWLESLPWLSPLPAAEDTEPEESPLGNW